MAPRVLVSDKLSETAVQIFRDRGIDVDYFPDLGKDKEALLAAIPLYDGLAIRSNTSVCLKVVDPKVAALSDAAQADFAKKLASLLEKEGVALDIGGYRDAPAGLRIWCGATVDTSDIKALLPWLNWAYATATA